MENDQNQVQNQGRGMKIAGLVLVIICVVFGIVGFALFPASFIALPIAVVGLVLSIIGLKKGHDGIGIAALVLSIIATVFAAIVCITCGICVGLIAGIVHGGGSSAGGVSASF